MGSEYSTQLNKVEPIFKEMGLQQRRFLMGEEAGVGSARYNLIFYLLITFFLPVKKIRFAILP